MDDQTTVTVDLEWEELSALIDYVKEEAERHARHADMLDGSENEIEERNAHLRMEHHYRRRHKLLGRIKKGAER